MKSLIFSSCVNPNVSRWKPLVLRWPNDRTNRPSILNKALHLTTCGDWESSPVKSMCECVFMYSTITAFKPPNKCVLELSSWSELHRSSLKRAAVVLSEALESVQTWHLRQHTWASAVILTVFTAPPSGAGFTLCAALTMTSTKVLL